MKSQSVFNAKKIFTRLMFSLIITASASAAHAQYAGKPDTTGDGYVIKYLGTADHMQVFSMQLNISEGNKYIVEINEDGNNVLFKQLYRNHKISKTFKIPNDIANVNFVITNIKNHTYQTYAVNNIVQEYNEVVVRKIN